MIGVDSINDWPGVKIHVNQDEPSSLGIHWFIEFMGALQVWSGKWIKERGKNIFLIVEG